VVLVSVPSWRFGVRKAHNEFAIASVTMGAAAAASLIVALMSDGIGGTGALGATAAEAAIDVAPRFLLIALPFAALATASGLLGSRFRFAGARASRSGAALGVLVLIECAAVFLGWMGGSIGPS